MNAMVEERPALSHLAWMPGIGMDFSDHCVDVRRLNEARDSGADFCAALCGRPAALYGRPFMPRRSPQLSRWTLPPLCTDCNYAYHCLAWASQPTLWQDLRAEFRRWFRG